MKKSSSSLVVPGGVGESESHLSSSSMPSSSVMLTSPTAPINRETQVFLEHLYDYLYSRDSERVAELYEQDFPTLSDSFYGNSLWPAFEDVVAFYRQANKEHQLILILYQELFYRHAFLRLKDKVTWELRLGAWQNYSLFFEFLAESQCRPSDEPSLCLPAQWLWDMFEEFCRQFGETQSRKWQLIQSIRDKVSPLRTPEEEQILTALWDPIAVLKFLYIFTERSQIELALKTGLLQHQPIDQAPLRYQIGYFSSVALLRLNNLFCDYSHALDCVRYIALGPQSPSWSVPACHLWLHYNVAFARLMCKEYKEAAKTVSYILTMMSKSRHYIQSASASHIRQQGLDSTMDKLNLIALICDVMSPQVKIDEFIMNRIADKYKNEYYRVNSQLDCEESILDLFKRVMPRFVSPASWDQNLRTPLIEIQQTSEISARQIALFAENIGHQKRVDQLLSFAKLYHNVSLTKLASLMGRISPNNTEAEIDSIKENVRAELLSVKSLTSSMAMDFLVDEDIVHIQPHKTNEAFVEQYARQFGRLRDLVAHIQSLDLSKLTSSSSCVDAA